jgi:hypothetical protein
MQRERGDELESELDLHADADVRSWTTRAPRTGSRQSPLVGLPPGASLIGAVDRPGVRRRYPVRIVRFERAVLEVDVPRVLEVWPAAVSRPAPDLAACERKGAYLDLASALMTAARRQLASGLPLRVYACRAGLHLHLTHEVITAWGALDHVAAVTAHDLPVWLQTRLRASGLTVSEITSHLDLARFRVRSEGESARVEVAQDGTVAISGKGQVAHRVRAVVRLSGRIGVASAWDRIESRRWALLNPVLALKALRLAAVALDSLSEPGVGPSLVGTRAEAALHRVHAVARRLGWVVEELGSYTWLLDVSLSAGASRRLKVTISAVGRAYASGDPLMRELLHAAGVELTDRPVNGVLDAIERVVSECGWVILAHHASASAWQVQVANGHGGTAVVVTDGNLAVSGQPASFVDELHAVLESVRRAWDGRAWREVHDPVAQRICEVLVRHAWRVEVSQWYGSSIHLRALKGQCRVGMLVLDGRVQLQGKPDAVEAVRRTLQSGSLGACVALSSAD